jgi:hypothetical protein
MASFKSYDLVSLHWLERGNYWGGARRRVRRIGKLANFGPSASAKGCLPPPVRPNSFAVHYCSNFDKESSLRGMQHLTFSEFFYAAVSLPSFFRRALRAEHPGNRGIHDAAAADDDDDVRPLAPAVAAVAAARLDKNGLLLDPPPPVMMEEKKIS